MKCECPTPNPACCNGQASAVFRVTRNGQRLSLCTRCDLIGDTERVTLADVDLDELQRVDPLGALIVALEGNPG